MTGYIASNIRSVEDYFQDVSEECLTYGWGKHDIEIMMKNALDRAIEKEEEKGTESDV